MIDNQPEKGPTLRFGRQKIKVVARNERGEGGTRRKLDQFAGYAGPKSAAAGDRILPDNKRSLLITETFAAMPGVNTRIGLRFQSADHMRRIGHWLFGAAAKRTQGAEQNLILAIGVHGWEGALQPTPLRGLSQIDYYWQVMTIATAFDPARFIASVPVTLHPPFPFYVYPIPPTHANGRCQPFFVGWLCYQ